MPKAKSKDLNASAGGKVRFIEPMYAKPIPELPEGSKWQYEIKFDGYRCLAGKTQKGIELWSRRGNLYTQQFPGIAAAGKVLDRDTLIDGELVALDENSRLSFNLLQHFRSKASAIQYYVFDLIFYRGKSLLEVSLDTRRKLLTQAIRSLGEECPIRLSESVKANLPDITRISLRTRNLLTHVVRVPYFTRY